MQNAVAVDSSSAEHPIDATAPAEHELKMTVPAPRAHALLALLRGQCRRDPQYPDGRVNSIYFDTRELALLRQKINSDFAKEKVRIRWYEDPGTGAASGGAFVELKRKSGGRRFKTRLPLEIDGPSLVLALDNHDYLRRMLAPLRQAGHALPSDLRPFLRISFRRRRFVDPIGGSRISLDTTIHGAAVGTGRLPWTHASPLSHAVVEVKGAHDSLPPWLFWLSRLGCRRESFSKYARCYLKLTRRSSF